MPARLRELLSFVRYLADRFIEDRAPNNAAALTYTTLFAVVPVMTVTFAMLSAIPAFQGTEVQIQAFIFRNFVPSTGATLEEYLRNFIEQARHLTWLGVALLAVTSFFMLVTVEKTFNDIWRVRIPRRGVSSFLLYWAVLSLGPLLLGAGFAMSTYLASVALVFGSYGMSGAQMLLKVTPLLFSIAAFTLMYAAVPNTRVPLRHALIGGALTGVLFEAAKSLFGLYVFYFPGYQLIYGAFATVPLFLVWIYVCWLIVLLGAEVVCSLSTTHHWRSCNRSDWCARTTAVTGYSAATCMAMRYWTCWIARPGRLPHRTAGRPPNVFPVTGIRSCGKPSRGCRHSVMNCSPAAWPTGSRSRRCWKKGAPNDERWSGASRPDQWPRTGRLLPREHAAGGAAPGRHRLGAKSGGWPGGVPPGGFGRGTGPAGTLALAGAGSGPGDRGGAGGGGL